MLPRAMTDDVLDLDTLAALYGPAGSGKSFVALDIAMRVARGQSWAGREVKEPRAVLYVALEGVAGMGDRVRAWFSAHDVWGGVGDPAPPELLTFASSSLRILDREHADALGRVARELDAGLVIVDTLARAMPGADENGSDMGLAVDGLDTVRRRSGACVLAVHHSGKDTTRGMRGHTSLLAALDTVVEVHGAEGIVTLNAVKQKYRQGGTLARGALKPAGPALAVEWGITPPVAFDWLVAEIAQLDTGGGVTAKLISEATGKSPPTVHRAAKSAVDAGLIVKPAYGRYALAPE